MNSQINQLYYITHIDNITSILKNGILSHQEVENRDLQYTKIYDTGIVSNRKEIKTPEGKSLWEYSNLYFQARNPMLYRVVCEKSKSEIAILAISPTILNNMEAYITTGNAAHGLSMILPSKEKVKVFKELRKVINNEYWNDEDGSKRKIMAEFLVPERIDPELIETIYVANNIIADKVKNKIYEYNVDVIPEPNMFFEVSEVKKLNEYLSIMKGDLFFSRLHTLTVSVNTVGIMGKGLASRAKYQFPDVYVYYQDLCRSRKLKMGKPFIYKRETSFDNQLADDPASMKNCNGETWFLLFATKRHWKEISDYNGIEQGMKWLKENYKKENIKSLAIPALGCGLGKLEWKNVGPMMCKYLSEFDIKVQLYLPAEKEISEEYLTKEYLLKDSHSNLFS